MSIIWNRREFLGATALTGAALAVGPFAQADTATASRSSSVRLEDRMTLYPATKYRPYVSKTARAAKTQTWVQFDLGTAVAVEALRLYPNFDLSLRSFGFPARVLVEGSNTPGFETRELLFDNPAEAIPDPGDRIVFLGLRGASSNGYRYLRLTATELRPLAGEAGHEAEYALSLAKVDVLADGRNLAEGRPATADAQLGNSRDLPQLTRKARPVGEGIVTDNPQNVTLPSQWKPVLYRAQTPLKGVELAPGLFRQTMDNNIGYLLGSFSVDEMLRPFRERAGKPVGPLLRHPHPFWDVDLAGSTAGRFLMGVGNTLRWQEHAELRIWLNQIVDGIAECRQPNGYIMAYPEDSIFHSERAGYTRAWVTHGLIEAGYAGNPKAFDLLRGYYDWFDHCPYLPKLLRGTAQGVQGMVANTRLYFTPAGKPEDLQVIQRYYQENYWLDGLAHRDEEMVWQYPYDRPHNYLITDFEAYLDLYRATGDRRYLDAVLGAWQLYHDSWEHVGGSIAITEFGDFPPKSYRLKEQAEFCETGELCGSSFWTFLNQRLHLLDPDQEKYVTEIEKSIYNIGIANQIDTRGLIYHARLVGRKGDLAANLCDNSCCEGQGTRLLGSLPEHLYSVVPDGPEAGLYVDLFAPSKICWTQGGHELQITAKTNFPYTPEVELAFESAQPLRSVLRVRTPSWAAQEMPVYFNGTLAATGKPGSYVVLDRTWRTGDLVTFRLPMALRLTRYTGTDKIEGHERYALEYGPILLAIEGSEDARLLAKGATPEAFLKQLTPRYGRPLHFDIEANPQHHYAPYFAIKGEIFTCYPVIDLA
jgi:DUF1680 family protein